MPYRVLASDAPILKAAFRDLGLKERPGPSSHPRITAAYRAAGYPQPQDLDDSKVSWCSAIMNLWAKEAGERGTGSLAGVSWEKAGEPLDTRRRLPRGAVVTFRYSNVSWQRHVTIVLEDLGATLVCLGGNQSNGVTISRFRRRALSAARWIGGRHQAAADDGEDLPIEMADAGGFASIEVAGDAGGLAAIEVADDITPAPSARTSKTLKAAGAGILAAVGSVASVLSEWKVAAVFLIALIVAALLFIGRERMRKLVEEAI